MPLTPERIGQIKKVFADASLPYDKELRTILFTGIDYKFFTRLRNYSRDAFQLSGDLGSLNSVDRLSDGSVPLAIWLRHAIEELSDIDKDNVFSHALDELTTHVSGAKPIENPADVPQVPVVKEAIVHRDDMVSFGFLLAGTTAGNSVARLQVPRYQNGMPVLLASGEPEIHEGTAWLLTPDLMITNHHVVNARKDGEDSAAQPDLEMQTTKTGINFDFDAQTMKGSMAGVSKLEAFDPSLDYAIFRLAQPAARKPLVLNREKIEIANDSYKAVNIIQHPYGGPKKVALRNNLIYDSKPPKLRYFTDTEHGSSGSPVFDDNWQVVALHRASAFVDNVRFQGRQVGWVNEGTQISALLDELKVKNAPLFKEITGEN
jgi:endonuclease G, mitochondrial